MQSITFYNQNGSMAAGISAPYILQTIDGVGGLSVEVAEQKAPNQDGSSYLSSTFNNRIIDLKITILASTMQDLQDRKRYVQKLFNPKMSSKLRYTGYNLTKEVECRAMMTPIFTNERNNYTQQFTVSIVCYNPFWLDLSETIQTTASSGSGFILPISFPFAFAAVSFTATAENVGDVETPIKLIFYGEALNPIVINRTTGKFIKVNAEVLAGERLEIDTSFGNKKVELVKADGTRENKFNLITLDSTFFQLQTGNNLITYDSDVSKLLARVEMRWKNRFLGL